MKKALLVLCLLLALTCLFVACDEGGMPDKGMNTPKTPTTDQAEGDGNNEQDPPTVLPITFEQFTTTHKTDATKFAGDVFSAKNITAHTVLGYSFETNADGKISAVISNSIMEGENNERKIIAEKITLTTPISINDAVEGNYTSSSIGGNYTQVEIFKFDAKQNYVKEDLSAALFSACGLTGGQAYFTEAESTDPETKVYEVAHTQNGVTTIYKIEVDSAETEEEIIANLQDSDKRAVTTKTQLSTGSQVEVEEYEQEEFQPESVEDLTENYSNYVHSALNEYFYPTITKTLFGRTFDESKLVEPEWRIITNDDNQITGFKFITKYNYSSTTEQYYIGDIFLQDSIAITDFTSENASTILTNASTNATYTLEFGFGYLKAEQGQHDALMNAIFKANGMSETAPEGAQRYFVDSSTAVDPTLGESKIFRVLQIEDEITCTFTIVISYASSDQAYITNLQNNKFLISSEENIATEGQKIDYKTISTIAELNSQEENGL